ncbi:MAG TPA: hypothetical protein ENO29_07490 [Candidatus Aminicenantes bacterium]|nr:MAG: hypothetical protein C0168_06500 [Candidatus Aminicenantes bacterium]HEK86179.1 hypothetical protein [Candidatus Aminicenantes bacterium]
MAISIINKFRQKGLKVFLFCLLVFSLMIAFSSCRQAKVTPDTLHATWALFQNPPAEYRPAPLWVWNDLMKVETIQQQMADLKDKGFGGVFVHPRPGLITPYLSEEWLSLFKEAVNTGQKLGLKVWIYDENSYPSGFAGGLVPAALPEAARSGLKATKQKLPEIKNIENLVCLLQETASGFVDITDRVRAGEKGWPEGNYWLFEVVKDKPSPWYGGFTYVDLMRPKVTEAFLHLTHDAYKRVCGEEFGQTVPGSFEDEAEIGPADGDWAVNYTPAIFSEFKDRRGYDLTTELPSLLTEKGDFRRIRHDFYLTCLELFIENWSKPYSDYCSKNKLIFTGHYWEHDWPIPRNNPDSIALNAYAHQPGIDILMNRWDDGPHAQFGNSRAVRELRSLANQLGRKRTLSETYGASGWDLIFFDQKRIGDWEFALGINFLNQHLSYVTIAGARKRDHPLSFSYHEPWWPHYRLMNDYFGRLAVVLSRGEQLNRILVIEPTTSAWMYYSPVENNNRFDKIAQDFQDFIRRLEQLQVEYDIGSEWVIKNFGRTEGKKFRVGERAYDLVILPPGTENLEPWTAAYLRDYLKNGGKVISWAENQIFIGGQPSSLNEEMKTYGRFKDLNGHPLKAEDIFKVIKPDLEFKNLSGEEKLFHHRRWYRDGQLLFLANVSSEKTASGEIEIKGRAAEKWSAFEGSFSLYPTVRKGRRLKLNFSLKPGESLILAIYNDNSKRNSVEKTRAQDKLSSNSREETINLEPLLIDRLDPNILTIDYGDLTLGQRTERNLYFYQAQKKAFNFHGFDRNPWDSGVQYQDNIISRNKFALGTGFKADYHFILAPGIDLKSLQLVVERPEIFKVQVNGRALNPIPGSWWLDRAFGVFPLEKVARIGFNTITLTVTPFNLLAELEPVYLLGDFSVEPASRGFTLNPPLKLKLGSWKNQGLPFYGHRVGYSSTIEVQENESKQSDFLLQAPSWSGALAVIQVNGQEAGYLLSPADWALITDKLKPGKNEISLVIYGTLKNTLGPHHLNPPAGMAWPGSFQRTPEGGQPPGTEYNFLDYGLFDHLIIKKIQKSK